MVGSHLSNTTLPPEATSTISTANQTNNYAAANCLSCSY